MLTFLISCVVLVLLAGLLCVIQIRIEIRVLLLIAQEQGTLDIEILPLQREQWKKQHRFQAPPGQLIAILAEKLSPIKQQYKAPGWFKSLDTASKIVFLKKLLQIRYGLLKHIRIKDLCWESIYGAEDAMQTAVKTGAIWAIKGIFISLVSSMCRLDRIQIRADPDFDEERLRSCFSGIFQVRLVHIILVGAHIMAWMIRGYLNGHRTAREPVQSSHRGINENCYAKY